MITSFAAKNFRLFENIEINNLSTVNLIVGRNNSGKSSFLEALEVYANGGSPRILLNILSNRDENFNDRIISDPIMERELVLRHLFYGHSLPEIGQNGITLGPINNLDEQLQIYLAAYRVIIDEEGDVQRTRLTIDPFDPEDDIEIALVVQDRDRTRRITQLEGGGSQIRRILTSELDPKLPIQVVPTRNMSADKVASLWDRIGLTDMATEVVKGLKLIEPSVDALAFVEIKANRQPRIPLVRMSNIDDPLPLKTLGDGTTRLLHIILALVNAKNGILLIDEFENGLHWSVQQDVWMNVFRLAHHLNVQVFATTHSRDCVSSFGAVWKQYPDLGSFYRLQRKSNNNISVKSYSLDTLTDSLVSDVEVR